VYAHSVVFFVSFYMVLDSSRGVHDNMGVRWADRKREELKEEQKSVACV